MLKIRFILLLGVLLGSTLSFAIIKGRGHGIPIPKKTALDNSVIRRPSQE